MLLCDLDEEGGHRVQNELGKRSQFIPLDAAEEQSWKTLLQQVEKEFDGPDILVNCAGIMQPLDIENTDYDLWLKIMRVNAGGCFLGCKYAIDAMKRHKRTSSIINVASTTALKTAAWVFAYGASKAAVWSMTKSMALRCVEAGYDIRCNAVLPGVVDTPMNAPILDSSPDREETLNTLASVQPIGRFITTDEVANAVLYFASELSSGVTGTHLCVDGGQTAG